MTPTPNEIQPEVWAAIQDTASFYREYENCFESAYMSGKGPDPTFVAATSEHAERLRQGLIRAHHDFQLAQRYIKSARDIIAASYDKQKGVPKNICKICMAPMWANTGGRGRLCTDCYKAQRAVQMSLPVENPLPCAHCDKMKDNRNTYCNACNIYKSRNGCLPPQWVLDKRPLRKYTYPPKKKK